MIERGSWTILLVASMLRLAAGLRAPTLMLGASDVPVGPRAVAVICGLVTGVALVRAATVIHDAAAGRRAAWMWAVLPLFVGAFSTATPLSALYAAMACALLALVRALQTGEARWWIACGALTGVGTLADWSALLLPIGLVLSMAGSRAMRAQLAGRAQGAGLGICLAIAVPVLWWRARSGWFPLHADGPIGSPWSFGDAPLERGVAFVVSEALVAGPLLAGLLAIAVGRVFRNGAAPARAVLARWLVVVLIAGGAVSLATGAGVSRTPLVWLAGTVVLSTSALVVERRTWWRAGLLLALALSIARTARLLDTRSTVGAGAVPPSSPTL